MGKKQTSLIDEHDHRSGCPIARTLDLLGDKWTLVIMRDALIFGKKTFAEFERRSEQIPTNLLASRLNRLVEMGLLAKVPYQTRPTRYHYLPTDIGRSLKPILREMRKFGEAHLNGTVKTGSEPTSN